MCSSVCAKLYKVKYRCRQLPARRRFMWKWVRQKFGRSALYKRQPLRKNQGERSCGSKFSFTLPAALDLEERGKKIARKNCFAETVTSRETEGEGERQKKRWAGANRKVRNNLCENYITESAASILWIVPTRLICMPAPYMYYRVDAI